MADDSSPKPKSKWPKRLLKLSIVFAILIWTLNGPLARWAVSYGIDSVLADQGLTGSTDVHGSLRTGFTLSNFSYTGKAGLQKIEASEISADYRLLRELIHGKVRSITLRDTSVIVDLDKFVASDSEKKTSIEDIKKTITLVHSWVRQPEITLENIDVTLLKSDELLAEFMLDSLTHEKQSDLYQLTGFQAKDSQYIETPKQGVTLNWLGSSLDLGRLEVLPDIAILHAQIDWSQNIRSDIKLQFLSAELDLQASDHISAELTSGALDAETIAEKFQLELPLDFDLNALNLRIENWLAPMPQWKIDGSLDLQNIELGEYQAMTTELDFTQDDAAFQLSLTTEFQQSPIQAKLQGAWLAPASEAWWQSSRADYTVNCSALANIPTIIPDFPKQIDAAVSTLALKGKVEVRNLALHQLDAALTLDGTKVNTTPLPQLKLTANYTHLTNGDIQLQLINGSEKVANLHAHYTFEDDLYKASLSFNEAQPGWLNALCAAFELGAQVEAPLTFSWEGTGHSDLEAMQKGSIKLSNASITLKEAENISAKATLQYDWPHSITASDIELREEDFLAKASLDWDGAFVKIHDTEIFKADQSIATVSAKLPFTRQTMTAETFLAQEEQWLVDADIKPIQIQKLNQWLKLHKIKQVADLEGSVSLGVNLIGSPHEPNIEGFVKLENLRGIANKNLAALHMLGEFGSKDQRLNFSGKLLEADTQRMQLEADIPFTPLKWVRNGDDIPAILQSSEVNGALKINTLPLNRIARLVPQLKEMTGTLDGDAAITGTLADPKVELNTKIDIPLLVIAGDTVDDIRDIKIECKADTDRKVTALLKATVNGGKFEANAQADLANLENPSFELKAKTNHAMVFRNDAISVRANADLKLAGTLEDATLSGNVGVVESLFYKDIDILPIGVPSSAVAAVELPSVDRSKFEIPIPEPFSNWKLDVKARMEDPILIRGNIARGRIEGGVRATGTLGNPKLDGTIFANKVVAKLPFSELRIDSGKVIFKSSNGLIPTLDIRGRSVVNNYDTSLYLYGSLTDPKTTFTSYPPLAKNDIMTLLATGVTASDLSNNKEAATLRALQLFLVKLKQESGQTRRTKALEKILSAVEDFEFNINETDSFTGRKFSSAKIKMNPRLYLTAQVDDQKNTRGLIVFVLKFR